MNLVRHELGLSKTESRFPTKGPASPSIRAPSTHRSRSTRFWPRPFPWCRDWNDELKRLFAGYVEAKQAAERARLR